MTEHATCKCGTIVPPGNELCEMCGMKEQLSRVVDENRRLREENAGLRRDMARRESRP